MLDKQNIRETAEYLLNINEQTTPPINVSKIANALGIEVLETPMLQEGMQDVSGFIARKEDGKFYIYVNEDEHIHRQRFTIAHELAHYYLHLKDNLSNQNGVLDLKYRNGTSYDEEESKEEKEANAFAAELLVPCTALKELWDNGNTDVAFLANYFVVSKDMMINRLKNCISDLNRVTRY